MTTKENEGKDAGKRVELDLAEELDNQLVRIQPNEGKQTGMPTKGPWIACQNGDVLGGDSQCITRATTLRPLAEVQLNGRLIAEAGTVYHETGLTPRELKEQRDRLLVCLKEWEKNIPRIDEFGDVLPDSIRGRTLAAIAAAEKSLEKGEGL